MRDGGAGHGGGASVLVELVGGKHLEIITEVRVEVLEVGDHWLFSLIIFD